MASDRFKAWAKAYGAAKLARAVGVRRTTVYTWLDGSTNPNDEHRLKILELAKRKLNLMDLFTTID